MYLTPKKLKFLLNVYPPYLGAGVKIVELADDWRYVKVAMKLRWYNRNAVGTHFGGSLYSMVDPQIMLMLMNILGKNYYVWDKSATVDYIAPAKTTVYAEISITDLIISDIKEKTQRGEKYLPEFTIEIKDGAGNLIARVTKVLYIKKKPEKNER
ncbi:DUF4442 domain-containing protein [Aliikangiella marina]|uniref:DUF4442 domain-containing protein n=1 Tax=Aliikangiella marina TaxID=1712262 RepID=A0A545TBY7_9GAMM|nr:DUF4442 domain-containing protein [Aliikangiella marina]TQV74742.1 DUF4442 domain-containing protein [Aliikangiella marina]